MASGETQLTVVGNLTGDPELRYTPTGTSVANLTVASTPRYFDKTSGGWRDGDTLFMRCNAWRTVAENAAESLSKGDRVIASGRLRQKSYQTREGEQRSVYELEVDEIGPSLRYATSKVNKVTRESATAGTGDDGEPPF